MIATADAAIQFGQPFIHGSWLLLIIGAAIVMAIRRGPVRSNNREDFCPKCGHRLDDFDHSACGYPPAAVTFDATTEEEVE